MMIRGIDISRNIGYRTVKLPSCLKNDNSENEELDVETEEKCGICGKVFQPGDKASLNEGCSIKHYLCEVCVLQYCIGYPTEALLKKSYKLDRCDNRCYCCRSVGTYYKVTMFKSMKDESYDNWKDNEDVRIIDDDMAVGIHEKEDLFCNIIVSDALMTAIETNETCKGPPNKFEKDLYKRYKKVTTGKFECYDCGKMRYNNSCCMVRQCPTTCRFKLCRICFALLTIRHHPMKSKEGYFYGIIRCPLCGKTDAVWNPWAQLYWCKAVYNGY
jgi:hypothetical protein